MTHVTLVGYSMSFSKTFLFGEEEGDSQLPISTQEWEMVVESLVGVYVEP
jgi:hypothetical protein